MSKLLEKLVFDFNAGRLYDLPMNTYDIAKLDADEKRAELAYTLEDAAIDDVLDTHPEECMVFLRELSRGECDPDKMDLFRRRVERAIELLVNDE